jgi:hypothetical protein
MAARKRPPQNLLARLTADIELRVGTLAWSVGGVPADELARVSDALLAAARVLRERYPELTEEAGSYHGGVVETPDEEGVEPYHLLPTLQPKRVGFRAE